MILHKPVYITNYVRSPWGRKGGLLAKKYPCRSLQSLGADTLKALLCQDGYALKDREFWLGCALTAGSGQHLARSIALEADTDEDINASIIQKVCGSGMMAMMQGALSCQHHNDGVLVGGIEHMSSAPFLQQVNAYDLLTKTYACGKRSVSHIEIDGLIDAALGQSMVHLAEDITRHLNIDRDSLDDYTAESLRRFQQFSWIHNTHVHTLSSNSSKQHDNQLTDEIAHNLIAKNIDRITLKKLQPFQENGILTAAHASKLADGCALLRLSAKPHPIYTSEDMQHPIHSDNKISYVRIVGYGHATTERTKFLLAPIKAAEKLLAELQWSWRSIDHIELGEAFATLPIAAMNIHHLSREQLNPYGGACTIGHPLSATAPRLVGLACTHMRHHHTKRAIVGVCVGGGEGLVMALERQA